jgi:predicted transcriptional regulator
MKCISKYLDRISVCPYSFDVKNSTQLINDLSQLEVDVHTTLRSFDIIRTYTNVPQETVIEIINTLIPHP